MQLTRHLAMEEVRTLSEQQQKQQIDKQRQQNSSDPIESIANVLNKHHKDTRLQLVARNSRDLSAGQQQATKESALVGGEKKLGEKSAKKRANKQTEQHQQAKERELRRKIRERRGEG